MPLPAGAPGWAVDLALAYESGAHGQFILYGNVHDRLPVARRLVNLAGWIEAELLDRFEAVFSYDLGNGLRLLRGGEAVARWGGVARLEALPREPLAALQWLGNYLRYLANLRAIAGTEPVHVACILRGADQILSAAAGWSSEAGALASLVRDWAGEAPFAELPFASLLIADNLSDLAAIVASNPRTLRLRLPLPEPAILAEALALLRADHPAAFGPDSPVDEAMAAALAGVTLAAIESLVKIRAHQRRPLVANDLAALKKAMVEEDNGGLIEFVEPSRSLADYHGQEALKTWLRQDAALWRAGDLRALPMGYLICGPVGTGKTFLVECLAGEIGVPVVKLKNFRDRWVGSSEGNLERIFRLIHALGRCLVFIDEADQALGRRDAGSGDSGLSGRLYAMVAQEMGSSANRGRVMWVLASSRPDLIEVDLKRPGRVDVKIPLLPTTSAAESAGLIAALCRRVGLDLDAAALAALPLPTLLTPGAAEAIAVKAYRLARTRGLDAAAALAACLDGYQPPVPPDLLEFQMRLAVREATDLAFVPESLRHLSQAPQ